MMGDNSSKITADYVNQAIKSGLLFQNYPKDLDPSYQMDMDLDLKDCFPSYKI